MSGPIICGESVREYIRDRVAPESRGYSTPCWTWQQHLNPDGYASGRPPGYTCNRRIARVAYEAFTGNPIPYGLQIDHLCNQRSCCNPEHLETVTPQENMARQVARRTTCDKGHPWVEENLYYTKIGTKTCLTCRREWDRARWPQRRAAILARRQQTAA
jgi:hypothetical protein